MADVLGQGSYGVRLDWGPVGAAECGTDVGVGVDVLSFSTTVTVTVERGTRVYPCPWNDDRARAVAEQHGAVLAVGRMEASRDGRLTAPSLSPAHLQVAEAVERLGLPSPNGSAIAASFAGPRSVVAAGCLRNAHAVARWLTPQIDAGRTVTLIAAGARLRHDGSVRSSGP